jgi:hypothetical protein
VIQVILRTLLWSTVLSIVCARIVVAQAQPFPGPGEKLEDIQGKTSAFPNQSIPEREELILNDLDKIDAEAANARFGRDTANINQQAQSD